MTFSPIFFLENFIAPKDSSLNFRGILQCYFGAIVFISAVMSIFEDFGSLLPARPVAVKYLYIWNNNYFQFDRQNHSNIIEYNSRSSFHIQEAFIWTVELATRSTVSNTSTWSYHWNKITAKWSSAYGWTIQCSYPCKTNDETFKCSYFDNDSKSLEHIWLPWNHFKCNVRC